MKIDIKKTLTGALPIIATVLSLGGMIASNYAEKSSREEMKDELKKELLEDLKK